MSISEWNPGGKQDTNIQNMSKPKTELTALVKYNQIGWEAIQHKDGWWVGNDKGVPCYGDHTIARAALTIVWQREGGHQLNYRICKFTGANVINGEHTPKFSADKALTRYTRQRHPIRVK